MKWLENVKGLQHIGIPTNDIDKTTEFYKALGFEVLLETVDGKTKVAFLELKGLVIETYENNMAALRDGAVDHIALDVSDIEEAYRYVTGLGIRILTEITYLPFWDNGVKFFIAEGPNLERIEFAQYL